MARTILFEFKGSTRSAMTSMAQTTAGLRTVGLAANRTTADFRAMSAAQATTGAGFVRFWGAVDRVGTAFWGLGKPIGVVLDLFKSVLSLGKRVVGTMSKMGLVLGAIGLGLGAKAAHDAAEFERTMVRVRMISGATNEEWAKMSGMVEKVIRESEFMPMAIADAAKNLAQMGLKGEAFTEFLPAVRSFATALGVDINEAAVMLLKAINIFKIDMKDAVSVVDMFADAANNSMLDAEGLATALRFLGPVAKSEGQTINTAMAVIMAAVDQAGETAYRAGSLLRSMFARLSAPSKEGKKVLDELGLSLKDIDPLLADYVTILERLHGMSPEQIRRFFPQETKGIAAALIESAKAQGGQTSKLREYLAVLEKRGVAEAQIAELNKTTAQQWDILEGSISGASIEIGNVLIKVLGIPSGLAGASDAVNKFADSLKNLDPKVVQGFFKALWGDISSGKIVVDMFQSFLDYGGAMMPMFVALGKGLGTAFLKGFLELFNDAFEWIAKQAFKLFGGTEEEWAEKRKSLPDWLYRPLPEASAVDWPDFEQAMTETKANLKIVRRERAKRALGSTALAWDKLKQSFRAGGSFGDEMTDRLTLNALEFLQQKESLGPGWSTMSDEQKGTFKLLWHGGGKAPSTDKFTRLNNEGFAAYRALFDSIEQTSGWDTMSPADWAMRTLNGYKGPLGGRQRTLSDEERISAEIRGRLAERPGPLDAALGMSSTRVTNDFRVQNTWVFGGPRNDLGSRARSRDPGSGR